MDYGRQTVGTIQSGMVMRWRQIDETLMKQDEIRTKTLVGNPI